MDAREVTRAKHAAELEAKKRKLEEIRRRKANVKEATVDTATTAAVAAAPFQDFLQTILDEEKQKDIEVTATNDSAAPTSAPTVSFAEKLAKLSTVMQVGSLDILPVQVELYDKATGMDPEDFPSMPPHLLPVQIDSSANEPEPTNSPVMTSPRKSKSPLQAPPPVPVRLSKEEREKLLLSADLDSFLSKSGRVMERALIQASTFDVMKDYSADGTSDDNDMNGGSTSHALKLAHIYRDSKWTKGRAVTDIDVSPFYNELSLVAYNARGYLEDDLNDQADWNMLDGGDAMADAEGVVLLWSSNLPSHPEYKFTCHSQVMSACFSPFDRNLLVGGTYSGQVVLWDTRAKHTPVQKTTLSAAGGHTHPIYSMSVVGTKTCFSLVSASTDGRMCVWNMNQLHTPMDVLDLRVAGPSALSAGVAAGGAAGSIAPTAAGRKMSVPVTAMAFQRPSQNPTNAFAIGTGAVDMACGRRVRPCVLTIESGDLWGAHLDELHPSASQAKAREVLVNSVGGPTGSSHFGPVTSMQYHPLVPHHQDTLLLTSSVDWSCRLWSQKVTKLFRVCFHRAICFLPRLDGCCSLGCRPS
ncbi:hypothetical protein, variant [Aphanomyces invadans]|uniref:Uncharacterized protein n=1 Tax=Aphanomyces invadans TaxID=157072 RepID=A0A024TT68_9STRA|nr:hypothetical protein, variant [Aphanomyces invadans]ETV97233.1 hypothetical protein, variant [Aphanomyces invadans]|eukprot:XP_008873941.1 hypothetical protein, variant [Aphanomyces invadans]